MNPEEWKAMEYGVWDSMVDRYVWRGRTRDHHWEDTDDTDEEAYPSCSYQDLRYFLGSSQLAFVNCYYSLLSQLLLQPPELVVVIIIIMIITLLSLFWSHRVCEHFVDTITCNVVCSAVTCSFSY